MKRYLANLAVLLAMCLLAVVLCGLVCSVVSSYGIEVTSTTDSGWRMFDVMSSWGGLVFRVTSDGGFGFAPGFKEPVRAYWHATPPYSPGVLWGGKDAWQFRFLGFWYGQTVGSTKILQNEPDGATQEWRLPDYRLAVPYWFLLALALIAVWWSLKHRRRALFIPGHCRQCGYDLRATPDRCPECGLEVKPC